MNSNRRSFLQQATLAGVAAVALPRLSKAATSAVATNDVSHHVSIDGVTMAQLHGAIGSLFRVLRQGEPMGRMTLTSMTQNAAIQAKKDSKTVISAALQPVVFTIKFTSEDEPIAQDVYRLQADELPAIELMLVPAGSLSAPYVYYATIAQYPNQKSS